MSEIQVQEYIDVQRFVILYEAIKGRFRYRRAIVDIVKTTKQIVVVSWDIVEDAKTFMNFERVQVSSQNYE